MMLLLDEPIDLLGKTITYEYFDTLWKFRVF